MTNTLVMVGAEAVASVLGISSNTVRIMARSGRLPAVSIGGNRWRFDPAAVARAVAGADEDLLARISGALTEKAARR